MTSGQDTIFDKKVQQLFFNVDVSNHSTSLVDKFANIQELIYKKTGGYVVYPLTGSVWTYTFKFMTQPYLTNHFDTGIIELEVTESNKIKKVSNIWWKLQFDK